MLDAFNKCKLRWQRNRFFLHQHCLKTVISKAEKMESGAVKSEDGRAGARFRSMGALRLQPWDSQVT
jgi:hypothetical protein